MLGTDANEFLYMSPASSPSASVFFDNVRFNEDWRKVALSPSANLLKGAALSCWKTKLASFSYDSREPAENFAETVDLSFFSFSFSSAVRSLQEYHHFVDATRTSTFPSTAKTSSINPGKFSINQYFRDFEIAFVPSKIGTMTGIILSNCCFRVLPTGKVPSNDRERGKDRISKEWSSY